MYMSVLTRLGATASLVSMLLLAHAFAEPCGDQPAVVTSFGEQKVWQNPIPSTKPVKLVESSNTRYLRILLRSSGSDQDWNLVIRDRAGRPLQSVSGKSYSQGSEFWTDRFFVNDGFISLEAEGKDTASVAETVRYTVVLRSAKNPYYSIQGAKENWVDVYGEASVTSFFRRRAESVGMFIGSDGDTINGTNLWTCTGFMVRNDKRLFFVTNDHCGNSTGLENGRWKEDVCPNSVIDFSWDNDAVSRDFLCEKVVARSPKTDLAVLEIRPKNPGEVAPKALPLKALQDTNASLAVIQHPASEPKKIAQGCTALTSQVTGISTINLSQDFAHRCDTAGGSSGAPILDESGDVVGIHHLGFEKTNDNKCDRLNKAVRVEELIALLKTIAD